MTQSVLIIGHNTGWNLEASYARAFEKLGWKVDFWEPLTALHRVARGSKLGKLFSSYVNVEAWSRKANLELLQMIDVVRPSIVLVIATEGVRAGTLGQLRAQRANAAIYCLFPDTPHNLVSDRIEALPMFDRVMTVSPAWIDAFRRLGAVMVQYLPLAADTDLHQPVSDRNGVSPTHDVAFVGNWRRDRENFLEQLADFDLAIWGSHYWKRNTKAESKLRTRWAGRPLFGADFAQACAANRILLNIIDGVGWPGPNMRAFEQPACRGFSLVTRTPAVTDLFTEGENIECFESVEEARSKIKFYLQNDSVRERIADKAYEFVINGSNTYADRAKQIIKWAEQDCRA